MVDSLNDVAKQTTTGVRTFLAGQVDVQIDGLGQRLTETSQSLRSLGEQARQDPNVAVTAILAEQAGSLVDRAAAYLRGKKAQELASDFEGFSRRQPLLATLAATVAGFTLSRALKASSTRRAQGSENV